MEKEKQLEQLAQQVQTQEETLKLLSDELLHLRDLLNKIYASIQK